MLRGVRSFLRWAFAAEAVLLLVNTIVTVVQHIAHNQKPYAFHNYLFHLSVLGLAVLLAASWWKTRSSGASTSRTAIAASIANCLLALIELRHPTRLPPDFLAFNCTLFAASLIGLYAFSQHAPPPPPARPKPVIPPVPGDCTRRWLDRTYTIPFILIILGAWYLWDRWAYAHDLPHLSELVLTLSFLPAELITSAIHESGHALAAALLRMRFLSFNIGPFRWTREDGHWRFRFHVAGLIAVAGAINVAPTNGDVSRAGEAWVVAAGPLANLCTAPVLLLLALHVHNTQFQQAWLFLALMATFSVVIAAFNLVPLRGTGGSYSDGARLLQLLTHSPALEIRRAERSVQSTQVTSTRFRDLDPDLLHRAADFFAGTATAIHYRVCASHVFEDGNHIPEAAAELAAAESIYDDYPDTIDLPALLHTAFIYFYAVYNRDAAAARRWWDRMTSRKIDRKNADYWLASAALHWIESRPTGAQEALDHANAKAQHLPHYGAFDLTRNRLTRLHALLTGSIMDDPQNPSREPATEVTRIS